MYDDITSVVDKHFWNRINDLRVHASKKQRLATLEKLKIKLQERSYFPDLPLTVKEVDKGWGVTRQIPIFNLDDYSVYYYCIKQLEHVLAKNRVENTYGGWSMGGKIRKIENAETSSIGESMAEPYALTYSYNPAAWVRYYGDFNGKLYRQIVDLRNIELGNYLVFELDIANYYDNIQLDILERKIRRDADYQEEGTLDLLMYFLAYSNRQLTRFQKRTVGLPQDAFGDCSRLLANYYLQDYDQYMYDICNQFDSVYFRYADDQIIFVPNEEAGAAILQLASRNLARLGLNINQKKVYRRTLDELEKYRSFEIFNILNDKNSLTDKSKVNDFAKKTFQELTSNPNDLKDRGWPLIKRMISTNFNLLTADRRAKLLAFVFDKDFIKSCKAYTLSSFYEKLANTEKVSFKNLLFDMSDEVTHSAFHYELLDFVRKQKFEDENIEKRIIELRKSIYEYE